MLGLIDGDVLAYIACKPRSKEKLYNMNMERIVEEFSQEEDTKYLQTCWRNFVKSVNDLVEICYLDDFLMAVKGPGNFRNTIYPEYKLNRKAPTATHNTFVPTIRELAVHEELAIASDGREADDLIRIWAKQAEDAGVEYIVITLDKDMDCIEGLHFDCSHLKFDKGGSKRREAGPISDISKFDAMRLFYEQLLKGDPVDNIPGIPQVGPKKAVAKLKDCDCEEDFQAVVVEEYAGYFGDLWFNELLSNGKLLYLQKTPEDYFQCSHWPAVQLMFKYMPSSRQAQTRLTKSHEYNHEQLSGGNTDVKGCGLIITDHSTKPSYEEDEEPLTVPVKRALPPPMIKKLPVNEHLVKPAEPLSVAPKAPPVSLTKTAPPKFVVPKFK